MSSSELTAFDGEAERLGTDAQERGGLRQVHPSFYHSWVEVVAGDLVSIPERGHSLTGPPIAAASQQTVPVQRTGEDIVRTHAGEHSDRLNDLRRCLAAVLSPPPPGHTQLRMHASSPMNREDNFTGGRIDVDNHFLDQGSKVPVLQPTVAVRIVPHGLQVRGQLVKLFSRRDHDLTATLDVLFDATFELADTLQRLIPAPL